jgi:hypothetical protein
MELDVIGLKGEYHPFHYPEQLPIHPVLAGLPTARAIHEAPALKYLAKDAKVLHYIASTFIHPGDTEGKKIVMQHGGRDYRVHHKELNQIYNRGVSATICQTPDLLDLGAKNEHWIYFPVDTDFLKPCFKTNDKLKIGHFPSLPLEKGTAEILQLMDKLSSGPLGKRFEYVGVKDTSRQGVINWTDSLKRVRECDIIIEMIAPKAQSRTYGEWGNTAIEGSALGKIVVTNSLAKDRYAKEYGECALHLANTVEDLEATLVELLSITKREINSRKRQARKWVEQKHSIPATARRLWDKIYKDFF